MKAYFKSYLKAHLTSRKFSFLRLGLSIPKGLWKDFRVQRLAQLFPLKPTTLNLLVNDICNSRCQMCLIWKNKKSKILSIEELRAVFQDDLFSDIEYIGVSGGEPTLRADLSEVFRTICSAFPKIKGVGIITNGIIESSVKQKILDVASVCQSFDVPFNVMFSLDGIGNVHDIVRGRSNNYDAVWSLLNFFHEETDIPTSFGCTITSSNALYVDELLDLVQSTGIYGRFRVAEFIQRLYNDGQSEYIRAFDEKMLYHLGLFFFRLEHEYENNETYQKTYRSIRGMLAEGKPRQTGCPYQSRATVLTAKGELLYCSPKSPDLGNVLKASAKKIYFSNINKRRDIVKKDCQDCIHDYHFPVTTHERISRFMERQRRKPYRSEQIVKRAQSQQKYRQNISSCDQLDSATVLIVGWYGTETIGDKAILWSVVNNLRLRPNPPKKIYLSSLYPFISQWTVKELNLCGLEVVETYTKEFEVVCRSVDEVIVGGGPLMDIEPLNHILYAFVEATKNRKIARIEGCGIGPLRNPLYTEVVSELFRLADHITLRDSASVLRGLTDFDRKDIEVVPDPATNYVMSVKASNDLHPSTAVSPNEQNVACFLRKLTLEYKGARDVAAFTSLQERFESQLVQMLIYISNKLNLGLSLFPMHTFSVGGDDRKFSRKIAKDIQAAAEIEHMSGQVSYERGIVSPLEILQSMSSANFNICMRFHSVLFAQTLDVPYIAIDYTNGGKIESFLRDKAAMHKLVSLEEVADGQWQKKLDRCLEGNLALFL